jgi:feruloyl esterase
MHIEYRAALLVSIACYAGPAPAATACAGLTSLSLPNTTITLAQSYAAGEVVVPGSRAPAGLCRVAGTVKPSSDSNIQFEVWIPSDGSWNGKYEQVGNGGFAGAIPRAVIASAVSRGYAAAATDDGTSGPPSGAVNFILRLLGWFQMNGAPKTGLRMMVGHPDVQEDFGYRAIKVTTDDSKAIIQELMGKNPRYSYFSGCSDGGREALMEAQRYPNDFDGIIVGSPANDWVGFLGGSFLWDMQALLTGPKTDGVPDAYIPASKLPLLSKLALAQCVGKDGGVSTDAFLNDPRQCHFDPEVAQCKSGQDPNTCLTQTQVEAVRKIYQGPHNTLGELLYPGYEPGGEANVLNWPTWLVGTSLQASFAQGFWCDEVLGDASCAYLNISIDNEFGTAVKAVAPIVSSINPDLRPFKQHGHGGKIIQYAGWADSAIAPENGLNYYRKVMTVVGDPHDFYRVFMVPGMAHCSGGAGPNAFGNFVNGPILDAEHDALKALERWVEEGIAPDQIIATKYVNDIPPRIAFQRPLCPYPQRSEYDGRGDPTEASSFRCVVHTDESDPRNIGVQAAYK